MFQCSYYTYDSLLGRQDSTSTTTAIVDHDARGALQRHCDELSDVLTVSSPLLRNLAETLRLEQVISSSSFAEIKDFVATLLDACKNFEVLKKIADILQVVHERFYEVANKINKEFGMFVCIT